MILVAVCEDNTIELSRLCGMLRSCGIPLLLQEYTNAENLLWDVETGKSRFDIYLLDIYLAGVSGVEAARRIRSMDDNAVLIFISVSEDFYRDAFDVYAFNYLIKPVQQATVSALLAKATEGLRHQQETVVRISYRGHTYALRYDEIRYISSSNRMLTFHLHHGENRICYGKLDEIAVQLKSSPFIRCHQSYIVNLRHVLERVPEGFRMADTVIPLSRTYAESAQEAWNRYLFGVFERE